MHTSAQCSVANILSVRLQLKNLKFPYTSPKVCDTSDSVKYHPYQACTTHIVVSGSRTLTAQNVSDNKMLLTTGMDANIQPITHDVHNFSLDRILSPTLSEVSNSLLTVLKSTDISRFSRRRVTLK